MGKNILKKLGMALMGILYITNVNTTDVTATELPASYDAREYGYITEKKSQHPYGTCWAFAGTAAAEASLIKSGLADNTLDLSEYHSAYYTYKNFDDPLDNANDDYGTENDLHTIMNFGGYSAYVGEQYAKWSGPVAESDMPYEDAVNLIKPKEDISNRSMFHLKKMIYGNKKDKNEIKQLIMQYGAVTAAYWSGSGSYYNYKDYECVTYHIPNVYMSNHGVCIIGWDDNYPKENFNCQPEKDGAWLVKNNDGKNQKWQYMSYETYIDGVNAFEFESADLLENNYQYDGFTASKMSSYDVFAGTKSKMETCMNVFKAKKSEETLEKVEAFMMRGSKDETCQVQIYVNPVIKKGKLVSYEYKSQPFNYTFEYDGLFKVDIPEKIYLNNNDTFGIELSGEGISNYPIAVSANHGIENINEGESFIGKTEEGNFSYVDLSTIEGAGNLKLKSFTNSTDIPLAGDVAIDVMEKSLKTGEKFKINATVDVPEGALSGISYASSDPSVVTVDSQGNVEAVAPGQAEIIVRAMYGGGIKRCTVNVQGNPVTSITMPESISLAIGETYQFYPAVNADASNKTLEFIYEGIAGVSVIENDVNVMDANGGISIANIGEDGYICTNNAGAFVVVVKATDGSGVEARCIVTVGTPSWNPNPVVPDAGGQTGNIQTAPIVTVTQSVSLGITKNVLTVGEQAQLTVTTVPQEAVGNLQYTISNPMVISLNGNVITGLRAGTATITAKALDSGVCGTVTITVTAQSSMKPMQNTVKIGTEFTSGSLKYEVTSKNTVTVTGVKKTSVTSATVPATVKYKKVTFKVTKIDHKSFYGCKKLKSVTIGKNIEVIGKSAFCGCQKLKTVTIKSKTIENVGKNAFKGIKSDAKITVPKSKYNAYKKLFKNAGLSKKAVWKKS